VLPEEAYRQLSSKFSKEEPKMTPTHFLEEFVSTLLAYANKLKHELSLYPRTYTAPPASTTTNSSNNHSRSHRRR
jgi:hypothetical protein